MSAPTDTLSFNTLVVASTTTNLSEAEIGYPLAFLTIINNGENAITISQASDSYASTMSLASGQGITFTAESNEVLPAIRIITGSGTTSVSTIHN